MKKMFIMHNMLLQQKDSVIIFVRITMFAENTLCTLASFTRCALNYFERCLDNRPLDHCQLGQLHAKTTANKDK